jgi:MinD superfamily P-loop ATPase
VLIVSDHSGLRKSIAADAVPRIVTALCRVCPVCLAQKACQSKAIIVLDRGEQPWIDASRCFGCRACVTACPFEAIIL